MLWGKQAEFLCIIGVQRRSGSNKHPRAPHHGRSDGACSAEGVQQCGEKKEEGEEVHRGTVTPGNSRS